LVVEVAEVEASLVALEAEEASVGSEVVLSEAVVLAEDSNPSLFNLFQ
jgi:hypothetical protein